MLFAFIWSLSWHGKTDYISVFRFAYVNYEKENEKNMRLFIFFIFFIMKWKNDKQKGGNYTDPYSYDSWPLRWNEYCTALLF